MRYFTFIPDTCREKRAFVALRKEILTQHDLHFTAFVSNRVELNFVITPFNEEILLGRFANIPRISQYLLVKINQRRHRFIIGLTINPFVLQDIIIPTDWTRVTQ